MEAFDKILADLRALSVNKSEQGTRFERLMKAFLKTDRLYTEQYESVWLWSEFPYNGGKHDYGIDLVAKRHGQNVFCAIQCKFYDPNNTVSKDDVDSFLSASGKYITVGNEFIYFSERIFISTTDKWTSTAEDAIIGQNPPVNRIRLKDLRESSIDWKTVTLLEPEKMQLMTQKTIRPHQARALSDVVDGFKANDRGKLIMACGTGKTFTSLRIGEVFTQGEGYVLFLVPSISLLNQSLIEWTAQSIFPFHVYAICSDPKASAVNDSIVDTCIPATTNVDKLVAQYQINGSDGLHFFFSTYQSIDVVARFQKKSGIEFDLIVCDEAHRTTGVRLADEDDSNFTKVHDNEFIHAKRRLYMTATPRIYGDDSKKKADEKNAILASMDDETIFGPEFHRLSFSQAVEQGLLSDYKPVRELVDHNPDEDQRDSEAKPAVVPSDDPQTPPSDEENGRLPPSPMQEEADADAPSGVQTPVENPACDTPSSEKTPTDKPAAVEPSDASPDTQGPTEKQATDSHPSTQEPVESDRVSPEQSGPEDAPSKERIESNPKQDSSSDGDKRSDKSTPGSGQPDKPNNGANPSKSHGSDKSTSRDADPGSRR